MLLVSMSLVPAVSAKDDTTNDQLEGSTTIQSLASNCGLLMMSIIPLSRNQK